MADRVVNVQLPNGDIQPITVAPEYANFSDEQVAKHEGGKLVGTRSDIVRSAGSGALTGATNLLTTMPKIATGAIGLTGKATGIDYLTHRARLMAEAIRAVEEKANEFGADYVPSTKLGRDVKAGAAGAVQIPTSRSFLPMAINALIGGAGGVAGQEVGEKYGELPGAITSMVPFGLQAGAQALRPTFAYKNTLDALEKLTPAQRAEINKYLAISREPKVDLNAMPWQVAPETTKLHNLGQRASLFPEANRIQQRFQEQLPRANQGTIKAATDPMFAETNPVPVSPEHVQGMQTAVLGVGPKRFTAPNTPDQRFIENKAALFGSEVEQRVPEKPIYDEQLQLHKALRDIKAQKPPNAPLPPELAAQQKQLDARLREVQAIIGGRTPWPTERVFAPNATNLGQVESIRKQLGAAPEGSFAGPDPATVGDMRKAMQEYAEKNLGPIYAQALRRYGDVAETVGRVESTASKTAGKNIESLPAEARISPISTLAYAGAVNPKWASIPIVRQISQAVGARQMDKVMALQSLEEMAKKASSGVEQRYLVSVMRSLMMPAQLGMVEPPMGVEEK